MLVILEAPIAAVPLSVSGFMSKDPGILWLKFGLSGFIPRGPNRLK